MEDFTKELLKLRADDLIIPGFDENYQDYLDLYAATNHLFNLCNIYLIFQPIRTFF